MVANVAGVAVVAIVACRPAAAVGSAPELTATTVALDAPIVPTVGASSSAAKARARADSSQLPYTEADVRFMSGMVGHHSQAIVMSRLAPERAGSASLRTLAARIVNAQQDEITLMQTWLADRDQPVPEARPTGMRVQMDGVMHDMPMPGMLTPDQMRSLAAARGVEFDRLFLEGMIQHHKGAVAMVQQLFGTPGAGQDARVFKFASDVNVDQSTEIRRMGLMYVGLMLQKAAQEEHP